MIKEIVVGKEYISTINEKVKVVQKSNKYVFFETYNDAWAWKTEVAMKALQEIPEPKKQWFQVRFEHKLDGNQFLSTRLFSSEKEFLDNDFGNEYKIIKMIPVED
jgi:hypothetical protein